MLIESKYNLTFNFGKGLLIGLGAGTSLFGVCQSVRGLRINKL